ncbi:ABC-2 type transport system permease protein [Prauserella shujinwangii]|uniref:ABC-2 type transport system permease protein n=1 Tax=Prauserella shujinwangii TaxID=1453103 RepID=A0A2T0LSV9_9PSEU|nr:ABC transporter permease [Prauserella shujinwangii]PRX46734.1 ABC-2 type transport system permease protein [Prauserella shujinwangii]
MTAEAVPTLRPGPRAWVLLILTEGKLVARDTAGLVIPLGLPMLIMVMNGLGSDRAPVPEFGGLPPLDAYVVPLTIAMVVALVGVVNMPSFLAAYRKTGVLRRLSVTPAHPAMVLVAQVVVSFVQSVSGVILALVVARLAFDVTAPRSALAAVGVFLLIAAAMYSVGMLVAAISPTVNSSVAIGLVVFFAFFALGGGFGGRENLPDWLATAGAYLPFGAGMDALGACWTGTGPHGGQIVALTVTAVLAGVASARLFRWS